jgi:glycogen operon protein
VEGDTDDTEINRLRIRQMKNMYTLLLTSRGVPMLLSGDEFANTQFGNNNAYCQDNEISWLDWKRLDEYRDLYAYVRGLNLFRKAHPVMRADRFDTGHNGTGYPELSFHGTVPWEIDRCQPSLTFAYMYAEDHVKFGTDRDMFIYVAVNAHWEDHTFILPIIPASMKWHLVADSNGCVRECGKEAELEDQKQMNLGARSMVILTGC